MKKKKICVISSSRAEYGILKELIIKLKSSKKFKTKVLVTGSHLVPKYGSTVKNIKNDKIQIDYKIRIKLNKNDKFSIIKDMSNYLINTIFHLLIAIHSLIVDHCESKK